MLQAQPSSLPSIADLLVRGRQAAMAGQRDLAREMLAHVVYLDPGNSEGWLWLSGVVDLPEQVRYCLERALRIDPANQRARRGLEWLDARQAEISEARAAAERVKPYWQTSKPKPLLNLVKNRASGTTGMAVTGVGEAPRKAASWTSIGLSIPSTRVSRSNAPTMPVSGSTLERIASHKPPVNDSDYRHEVLEAGDDLAPRFVTNVAIHNLLQSIRKVTGELGLDSMLALAGLEDLKSMNIAPNEDPAVSYTGYSALGEAMEEFYNRAVDTMELKVGREMFRHELALKGKMAAMKGIQFKLMSPEKKLESILMELADAHARMGMDAYFEEQDGGYLFVIETCPYCYGRLTNVRCGVTTGFLGAGIEWATGHSLPIEEVSCRGLDQPYCGYWIATA